MGEHGRPRAAVLRVLAPLIAELAGGVSPASTPEALFGAVNRVKPTFIRVEADEATYGLHIVLRFELEQALIEGTLTVASCPRRGTRALSEYLGIKVPDDADGVLQDVHWAAGMIGYFPTYALGNLIAGQLWERAHADIRTSRRSWPPASCRRCAEWLGEHIHRHGAKFTTTELLQRATGGADLGDAVHELPEGQALRRLRPWTWRRADRRRRPSTRRRRKVSDL